jgi:hypothetical protein
MGRRTCASASARSFDAQPAQLESEVSRICLPVVTPPPFMIFGDYFFVLLRNTKK